jgi:hypothetical protein
MENTEFTVADYRIRSFTVDYETGKHLDRIFAEETLDFYQPGIYNTPNGCLDEVWRVLNKDEKDLCNLKPGEDGEPTFSMERLYDGCRKVDIIDFNIVKTDKSYVSFDDGCYNRC